jgi:hypothetical protein
MFWVICISCIRSIFIVFGKVFAVINYEIHFQFHFVEILVRAECMHCPCTMQAEHSGRSVLKCCMGS